MDITELTLAEVADVERLSKQSFSTVADQGSPKGKVLQALAYVIKRREDPKYKFEDAGKLTFTEANALLVGDTDPLDKKKTD